MTLDDRPSGNSARNQINDFLDLCSPDQVELSRQIVKTIYEHRVPKGTSPDSQTL